MSNRRDAICSHIYRLELDHTAFVACNRGKEHRVIVSYRLETQVELGGKDRCIGLYENNHCMGVITNHHNTFNLTIAPNP